LNAEASPPRILDRPAAALISYAGHYRAPLADLELSVAGAELRLQTIPRGGFPKPDSPPGPTPPPTHLTFATPDLAYVADGPAKGGTAEFLRDADGSIAWLRMSGRLHARIDGIDRAAAHLQEVQG
jgi:hypothetical protein